MASTRHHPETNVIDLLPDDVLLLILSFLPNLAEIARTSILSRRWRHIWHGLDCLDFDAININRRKKLYLSKPWYVAWVNKVIEARSVLPGLPSVREFRIRFPLDRASTQLIDHWIDFAMENRVHTLQLDFCPYEQLIFQAFQYKLSPESWYRATSGLKNLKSLSLSCVSVTKTSVEFILSSCPLLEDLLLYFAANCNDLDISSGSSPLRLQRLVIDKAEGYTLTKLCAPYLTSLYHESDKFDPQIIDTPMLTDLTIGRTFTSQPIMQYLTHFWTYLPQLEKLHLLIDTDQDLKLQQIPELVKLKYLKIEAIWDTDHIFSRIIDFIKGCPVLETFAFEIFDKDLNPAPRYKKELERKQYKEGDKTCSFGCLKVLELYGGYGKTIDQEVVKCVISEAPNLEKLNIETRTQYNHFLDLPKRRIVAAAKAKAKKLCRNLSKKIDINVVTSLTLLSLLF